MDKFIKELENVETNAFNSIIQMFNTHDITELDVSNKNEDFEDLEVFVIDDGCNWNRIKINNIILKNNCLKFIDDNGNKYEQFELIEGSMPYIYRNVKYHIENSVKIYHVVITYHGAYSTLIHADSKENAIEKVKHEVQCLSDLEFMDAIEIIETGTDVQLVK